MNRKRGGSEIDEERETKKERWRQRDINSTCRHR